MIQPTVVERLSPIMTQDFSMMAAKTYTEIVAAPTYIETFGAPTFVETFAAPTTYIQEAAELVLAGLSHPPMMLGGCRLLPDDARWRSTNAISPQIIFLTCGLLRHGSLAFQCTASYPTSASH